MSQLKVTGTRSLLVICDCGSEHKLSVDKNGEYALGTTSKNPGAGATAPATTTASRKRTIFDAPLPSAEDGDDDDE